MTKKQIAKARRAEADLRGVPNSTAQNGADSIAELIKELEIAKQTFAWIYGQPQGAMYDEIRKAIRVAIRRIG